MFHICLRQKMAASLAGTFMKRGVAAGQTRSERSCARFSFFMPELGKNVMLTGDAGRLWHFYLWPT
jgi:hypothetical protein